MLCKELDQNFPSLACSHLENIDPLTDLNANDEAFLTSGDYDSLSEDISSVFMDSYRPEDTQEIDEFTWLFNFLDDHTLPPSSTPLEAVPVPVLPPAPAMMEEQQHQPFFHVPLPAFSLASHIPMVDRSSLPSPALADAASKRAYRKRAIAKWMQKRERRRWIKGATYSKRSEVAVRRPRDNGKFVKSKVRFVTMNEFENEQAQF